MKRRLATLVVATVTLLAAACSVRPQRHEYSLNPDGSGKVVYEVTDGDTRLALMFMDSPTSAGFKRHKLEQIRPGFIEAFLGKSEGVVAWQDIQWKVGHDGLAFQGTAYFENVAKLRLHRAYPFSLRLQRSEDGTLWLETVAEPATEPIAPWPETDDTKKALAREEAPKEPAATWMAKQYRTALAKEAWKKEPNRALLDVIVHLPGRPRSVSLFSADARTETVHITYRYHDVMKAITELHADEAFLRNQPPAGRAPWPLDALHAKLFGAKGMPRAAITGRLAPRFDFRAEVEAARKALPALREKLGLAAGHQDENGKKGDR